MKGNSSCIDCNDSIVFFPQVKYKTIDRSAFHGKDFTGGEGVIFFKSGETTKDILIPIIDDMSASGTDEYFEVDTSKDNFDTTVFAFTRLN